jgi:polyisoprenoid-binding protein YceI
MKTAVIVGIIVLFVQSTAVADTWNLPQDLTSENATVTFEVDSTWHMIHGVAKEISGKLWLADAKDFRSIRGSVVLPVAAFDTESTGRDRKLREVMHSDTAPTVTFSFSNSIPSLCDPKELANSLTCTFDVHGDLTINSISKHVILHSQITQDESSYKISGTTVIRWLDYKVEDPSILIAKLHDEVRIDITVVLAPKR